MPHGTAKTNKQTKKQIEDKEDSKLVTPPLQNETSFPPQKYNKNPTKQTIYLLVIKLENTF